MRLIVDALSARTGGGLSYITRQLDALGRVRPDWTVEVLAAPWNREAIERIHGHFNVRLVKVASLAARLAYQQAVLPFRLRGFDALYCPGNFIPVAAGIPTVVTQQNPNYFGAGRRAHGAHSLRRTSETLLARASMRRARAVVVISQSLSADMDADGIARANRHVILSGTPTWVNTLPTPPSPLATPPFVLSVANDYPHKNLERIVEAWCGLRYEPRPTLVLAGQISSKRRGVLRSLVTDPDTSRLVLLGPVEPNHVRWLFGNASVLVSASSLEAFPLTPAEAGSLGCPVLLSDIPAHREVAGSNAHYFSLDQPDGLQIALEALLRESVPRIPWYWPVTWEENAESLARLIEASIRRA